MIKNIHQEMVDHFKAGNMDIVRYLVNKGADVSYNDNELIKWASGHSNVTDISYLLSKGVNIHVNNEEPIMNALINKQFENVDFLKMKGAQIKEETPVYIQPKSSFTKKETSIHKFDDSPRKKK